MGLALSNIKLLLDSLRENDWYITAFPMDNFLGHDYAVVIEDLRAIDRGSKYYAVQLTFIDMKDDSRTVSVRANAYGFDNIEIVMNYFGIIRKGTGKHPEYLIYNALNNACPAVFTAHPVMLKRYILSSVISRDSTATGKGLYCYDARHNGIKDGKRMHRTEVNTAKTRLLRPSLFELLGKSDNTVSFYYSAEPDKERSDGQIAHDFYPFGDVAVT